MFSEEDIHWMKMAIQLAKKAREEEEVPVGAILIKHNQILGQGSNRPISHHDPTAHAEIVALREAGRHLSNYRLIESTLYVTLEPCLMCVGALIHARVKRVVFGAFDPKTGAVESVFQLGKTPSLNHQIDYQGGLFAEECADLLKDFFKIRRN